MSTNMYMDINIVPGESEKLTENNYLIFDHILEKDKYFPMHFHDYFELEVIISGKVEYVCNKTSYIAERGFVCLLSSNDIHSLKFLEDTRILNIRFTDKILPEELKYMSCAHICNLNEKEIEKLLKTVNEITDEQQYGLPYSKILISNKVCEIMINTIRKTDILSETSTSDSVQKVLIYINKHFKEDINLISCAKALSLSSDYLGRIIKKATGSPFTDYLNMTRMKYATTLLLTTKLSVKEIAAYSGYNSTEYFLYKFPKLLLRRIRNPDFLQKKLPYQ